MSSNEVKCMDCRNGCGATICFNGTKHATSGKAIPIEVNPVTLEITGIPHNCPKSDYNLKKAGQAVSTAPKVATATRTASPVNVKVTATDAATLQALISVIAEHINVTKEVAVNTRANVELLALFKKMHPDLVNPQDEEPTA